MCPYPPNDGEISPAADIPVAKAVTTPPTDVPVPEARPVQRLPMPMPRWRALLELVVMVPLAFLIMISFFLILNLVPGQAESWPDMAYNIISGLALIIVALVILRVAGHQYKTIGWTSRKWLVNIALGLAALFLTYILLFCAGMILMLLSPDLMEEQVETQDRIKEMVPDLPFAAIVLLMLWVTFWEEFIFRGFLLTRLHALCGRWWLAVPAGSVLFGLLHLLQGPVAAVVIGLLGLIIGTLFVWRKSLIPGWAFHFAHNVLIVQLVHSGFFNLPG